MTITKRQAHRLLLADMKSARQAVARHVRVNLSPTQHDALADFAFNVGEGRFSRSSVLRHVNNGNLADAAISLLQYVHDSHGRVQPGLVTRRKQEFKLLLGV